MAIRIGCCGFPTSQARYMRTLPVLEVQKTFYQPPRLSTLEGWRQRAPADFEFTLKAWQLITHEPSSPTYRRLQDKLSDAHRRRCGSFKPTDEVMRAWERTLEAAQMLRATTVVFQCPARFKPEEENLENMRRFFGRADRHGLRFVWEPRGAAWGSDLVGRVCRQLHLVHGVDPFSQQPAAGPTRYYRLHGRTGYRYKYTTQDLRQLAHMCRGRPMTYVLFNNDSMWDDARRFQRITEKHAGATKRKKRR